MSTTQTKARAAGRAVSAFKPIEAFNPAQAFKTADEVANFGKANLDALMAAGTNFFRGWEELTRSVAGLTQSQVETSLQAATALLGAKSLSELGELHKSYAKATFDNAVSEASRFSELAIRIATETAEPLNAQVTAAVERFSKPALAAA